MKKQEQLLRPWQLLMQHEIGTVIDVGANKGLFPALIRELLPETRVWSFEPLPDVFARLANRFAADSLVNALPYALSDHEGVALIQRSAFSPIIVAADGGAAQASGNGRSAQNIPRYRLRCALWMTFFRCNRSSCRDMFC